MEAEANIDGAYRVSSRIRAVLLSNEKNSSGEISLLLGAARSRVSNWLKTYEEQGVEGLMEGERSGRPSLLTDLEKVLICDIVDSGPVAYGFLSGVWTSKLIAEVINDEFGVNYHPGHVWKILQEFGFSVQSPKRLLANADSEKKEYWIKKTYPAIKKKPKKIEDE
ncbi:MAG: winged helix-turn-helix domain-containing protein [Bdellovibrionaceae bacterium]|nr:winged helix-turn-helix domain-containing protein [Pseudobdellovibrionaceae bacterium]